MDKILFLAVFLLFFLITNQIDEDEKEKMRKKICKSS